MVTVAEILKNSRLAVEQSEWRDLPQFLYMLPVCRLALYMPCHAEITTGLDAFNDDGRERAVQKPKMEIVLRKSEEFDQVMAQQTRVSQPSPPVAASLVPAA